ncbi:MAG: BlaI/MecI/CopY family transcriptional regulator [Lachnospiraceae bacterium]|nr:BlaI/MecI/CopY family transcriptional regulator [Lachnospiraceae bacterium]
MNQEALSECEELVMKVIWQSEEALSIQEITTRINQQYQKDWKVQTVSTFLSRMVKKEYLTMKRQGRLFYYYPLVSESEYGKREITKCVEFWGKGKVDTLLAAFTEVRELTEDEKKSIRSMLDALD